jgi:hypothetical protein
MPAGEYTFDESQHLLTVRSLTGGHGAMILTGSAWSRTKPTEGTVEFRRYGDAYFLSGLWRANSQDGFKVPEGPKERELARRLLPQAAAVALTKH